MVAREPTSEEVRGFLEFAGLSSDDESLAVRALKQGNYDVNQLVMEFYDGAESFRKKYSWDESAFSSGRDGTDGDAPASFHIESGPEQNDQQVLHGVAPGQDTTYYGQTAPSRPPTRTMNRSPLGRAIDDLASATIPGPTAADDEDEDLKRALMESANEAGLDAPPPQTSGVVSDPSQQAFGPATREQYDMNQWAMVRKDPSDDTSASNIAPSARKRDPGTPVLLFNDSSSIDQRLGSILTILHEIPLARNALLKLGSSDCSYGHNNEWWAGKPILPPHISDVNSLDEVVSLEEEIHRLLGFLESTERRFGSTRVLSDLLSNTWDMEETFFTVLMEKHGPESLAPLVHEVRTFQIGSPDAEHRVEDCDVGKICYFKFNLSEDNHKNLRSLYDVLDYEIWKQALEDYFYTSMEHQAMSLFSDMGDVLVMTVADQFRSTAFEIPEVWYPERYLWSRKKEAIGIQWLRRRMRAAMKGIQEKLAPYGESSLADRLKMLEAEVTRCDLLLGYLNARPRFRALEESGFNGKVYPNGASDAPCNPTDEEKASLEDISAAQEDAKLQRDKLKAEIQELESELERYKASERFVGRLFTDPARERPSEFSCKGYSLRGITTTKDVVYVCRRFEEPLIELGDVAEPRNQWWRLEHTANREQPVQAEKLEFDAIHARAWAESNTLTLIFATDDALNAPRDPLPDTLARFVKADNRWFQRELEQESAGAAAGPRHEVRAFGVRSRAGSADSMASNRASVGSMDSRGEEFVHEIHPDQLPDSDGNMEVDEAPRGRQDGGGEAGEAGAWGAGAQGGDAEEGQEMSEVSAKPIFVTGQDGPPPLPDRE